MNGLQSPHKLFNAYIKAYANYAPLDYDDALLVDEGEVQVKVDLKSFEWERLKKGMCLPL
jgi:hypothetical protein